MRQRQARAIRRIADLDRSALGVCLAHRLKARSRDALGYRDAALPLPHHPKAFTFARIADIAVNGLCQGMHSVHPFASDYGSLSGAIDV